MCKHTPQLPVPHLGTLVVTLVTWVIVGTVSLTSLFVPPFRTTYPLENIGSPRVPGVF